MEKTILKSTADKRIVPKDISDKKQFLKLPLKKRIEILKKQASEMLGHYENDREWKEFRALDIYEY